MRIFSKLTAGVFLAQDQPVPRRRATQVRRLLNLNLVVLADVIVEFFLWQHTPPTLPAEIR